MRFRLFSLYALALLLFAAGCERSDHSPLTAELDEPGYRRGKDLIKQGRNQEALSEFQKVIETRGLNNAAESHLEVGLLYQQHIKDPLAAIFHYRKFRELKPNSPQADLVRQRIDAATRDFARTLPAQPMETQLDRLDMSDMVQSLRRENDKLKGELAAARAGRSRVETESPPAGDSALIRRPDNATTNAPSPVANSPVQADASPVSAPPPSRVTALPTAPARPPVATSFRRHVVVKGDTLFSLAQRYYGNRSRWRDISAANRDVMKSDTDLKIGMVIKIPQ